MTCHRHVGLDFDDTLIPTRRALLDYFNRTRGTNVTLEALTVYKFAEPWGYTAEKFAELFTANIDEFHAPAPFPGVLKTLAIWARHSTFHVITGRPPCWLPATEAWLRRYEIPFASLHSVENASDKACYARRENVTFFVEDHGPPALCLAEAGIDVHLLDTPTTRASPIRASAGCATGMRSPD